MAPTVKETNIVHGWRAVLPTTHTATLLNWADRRQEQGCLQVCYSNFLNISRYRKEKPRKIKIFEEGHLKLTSTVCENTANSPREGGFSAMFPGRCIYMCHLCLCSRSLNRYSGKMNIYLSVRQPSVCTPRQSACFESKTAGRILIKPDMSMTFNFPNIQ
jgi:hypothetical protein